MTASDSLAPSSISKLKAGGFSLRSVLLQIVGSSSGQVALLALALSSALFYSLDWLPLRSLLTHSLVTLLEMSGYKPQTADLEIIFPVARFPITAECTYADLALFMTPFAWRQCFSQFRNGLNLLCVILAIGCINEIRVLWAIIGTLNGHSWFIAHDAPDILVWYGSLAIAIWRWGRSILASDSL